MFNLCVSTITHYKGSFQQLYDERNRVHPQDLDGAMDAQVEWGTLPGLKVGYEGDGRAEGGHSSPSMSLSLSLLLFGI